MGKRLLRGAAALLVLVGGLLHYQVWNKTYRHLPTQIPGVWVVKQGFPVNVLLSIVMAVLLGLTAVGMWAALGRLLALVALALELGSIAFLVLSRGPGIMSWQEKGDWSMDPKRIL